MWKDLTAQQKSDLMDIFLSHGVTSLDEMRSFYDSNGYSSGGSGNRYSGEDTPTQQMTSSFTASHPEYNPATNKWETTIESVLPEIVVTGKRIIKPSQNNNKQEKQRHVEPQTFAGRVAQVAGASSQYVKGADILSSIAQMSPQGHYIAALDLGYDANRAMHEEEGALKDVGLDALSMLPYVSKLGLKEVKPKTIQKAAKNFYDKMLQPVMDRVNNAIKVGKRVDFIDDTMGNENAPLHKKPMEAIYMVEKQSLHNR